MVPVFFILKIASSLPLDSARQICTGKLTDLKKLRFVPFGGEFIRVIASLPSMQNWVARLGHGDGEPKCTNLKVSDLCHFVPI